MNDLLHLLFMLGAGAYASVTQDLLDTVSIADQYDFQILRPCVRHCLYADGDVAPGAGCVSPHYNHCWCSSNNIAPSATSHISKCVTSGCFDNVDVATAIDIYYDYCSNAGFPIDNSVARPVASSVDMDIVSIAGRTDFQILRPCVRNCLYANGDVAPGAGCISPHYNQCWCSSNIAVSATSYISTCVTELCPDDLDVATAIDIYTNYCSQVGYAINAHQEESRTEPVSTAVETTSNEILNTKPTATARKTSSFETVTQLEPSSTSVLTFESNSLPLNPTVQSSVSNPSSSTSATTSATSNGNGNGRTAGETAGIVIGVFALSVGVCSLWYQRKTLIAALHNRKHNVSPESTEEIATHGGHNTRRGVFGM